jgi:hypothetical protein
MPLFMKVSIATGTGIERAAEEMVALADITRCMVETEIRGVPIIVSPGASIVEVVRDYHNKCALFDRWAIAQAKKGEKP